MAKAKIKTITNPEERVVLTLTIEEANDLYLLTGRRAFWSGTYTPTDQAVFDALRGALAGLR